MDKNAIKKYAVWARRELISRVSQRAAFYGITKEALEDPSADSVNGVVLTAVEKKERQALLEQIKDKGYEEVMEEVAYTWFNRFSALRFMEVNGYLPTRVRVFTDENNAFKPQILAEAINMELDGLDMEKVYAYKEANDNDQLYKYLLITQCNALNSVLPGMFQRIEDYTELLFPENLLREGSAIQQMIELIPEEDWKDQVQIIGWLYQYYNSEKKGEVFAALKKNVKITKENIPAATQLFTPDWIVRYMVENSLGRLWVEGHPNDELKSQWKCYLEEAEQEPEVQAQLAEIRKEYAAMTPEQIRCIDPCAGSGHIIAYLFDVLVQIYEAYGVDTRTAVSSIVENNIYGLDIDDRAAQLAYFSVMMKACQYDRRFLRRKIQPHVYAIVESNHVDKFAVEYFCNGDAKLKAAMNTIISELHDAKEYGSILTVTPQDWSALYARFEEIQGDISMHHDTALQQLLPLVQVAEALAQKYDVVVTNPPYMGSGGMSDKLIQYLRVEYSDTKNDLFSVLIKRMTAFAEYKGLFAYIAPQSWMFLSTQEDLRAHLLDSTTLVNLLDLGTKAFDSGFGTATAVFSMCSPKNLKATCMDLTVSDDKERLLFSNQVERYECSTATFVKLPGKIFSYSCTDKYSCWFEKNNINSISNLDCGIKTGNNSSFVRMWYEVSLKKLAYQNAGLQSLESGQYKWFKYSQGGGFHRWYGAIENVVDLENDAANIKRTVSKATYRLRDKSKYFLCGMVWPMVGTNNFSCRYLAQDVLPDIASNVIYCANNYQWELLAYMNSKVFNRFISMVNPTVNYPIDSVAAVPYAIPSMPFYDTIVDLSKKNMHWGKEDWDAFETSWDFQRHPLIAVIPRNRMLFDDPGNIDLAECYMCWEHECEERFNQLKANEEELNRIFIDIYGLQDELTPEVEDKDVTVRKADLGRDIRSLISYAVGCMFGRYSLNAEGLAYAGGEWDGSKYAAFPADPDNIIPICDDEYFEDDIVGRFVKFIETVYGKKSLETNLEFIANALGGKGQPREVIRNYFLNDFYKDHCKIYQKRPIYWLFDSGKKNGFKCLIYMHRYQPDTIARIRTDYVHEQQARYRTAIADLENRIANASTGERVKLNKQLKTLNEQAAEIHAYEEKIHHLADQMISIDLDDGVKHNYAIFQDVLAKIK